MEKLKEVEELGGEGLMLRKAGSYVLHVNPVPWSTTKVNVIENTNIEDRRPC